MLRSHSVLIAVLAVQALSVSAHGAAGSDPWQSVKQLPSHGSFTFVERNLTCHYGQVKSVAAQSVVVRTDKLDITVQKANLLRIRRGNLSVASDNPYLVLSLMYSGRSSWVDLLGFMTLLSKYPNSIKVRLSVAMIDGKLRKGDLKDVTETEIVLVDSFFEETRIPRTEVSRVDYIQTKPLSDSQEFDWEELTLLRIFDPKLYPRLFHLGDTMPVRMYDRAVPEDDSPVRCR